MPLVIAAKKYPVLDVQGHPLPSSSFLDDKKFALGKSGYRLRRTNWVRGICLHTRMGVWPIQIQEQGKNRHWDEYVAKRWEDSGRMAGAHVAIDADGSFVCLADLQTAATYHAGQVNEYSIGIEMYQEPDGLMYKPTLMAAVALVDEITRRFGIQRQVCSERQVSLRFASPVRGRTKSSNLAFHPGGREGRDFVGIYGHRNCTRNRGLGDPGDLIFQFLKLAGYEEFDADADEDRHVWQSRQAQLGLPEDCLDGIAGPMTCEALLDQGKPYGLWVPRPTD